LKANEAVLRLNAGVAPSAFQEQLFPTKRMARVMSSVSEQKLVATITIPGAAPSGPSAMRVVMDEVQLRKLHQSLAIPACC
jgi:hypothetical protein